MRRSTSSRKAAVSAEILAIETRLVAIDQLERAGVVAEGAEGQRTTGGVVFVFAYALFDLGAHLLLHVGLFDAPDPHLTPAGYGHVFDEGEFDGGLPG